MHFPSIKSIFLATTVFIQPWLYFPAIASPGDLDTTFDTDGISVTTVETFAGSNAHDDPNAVAVLADGKVLVGGRTHRYDAGVYADIDYTIIRYNIDGSLDTNFGTGGVLIDNITAASGDETPNGMIVLSDGSFVLSGRASGSYITAKYTSAGVLDTSFGSGAGYTNVSPTVNNNTCFGLAAMPDGKLVLVGDADMSTHFEIAVALLNSDGSLDTSFGTNGFVITLPTGYSNAVARAVAVQPDGKILVTGDASDGTQTDFFLMRLNTDGSLDNTFDTTGIVTTDFDSLNDIGRGIAIQPDGRILVTGSAYSSSGTGSDFGIARYLSNGTLDTSFNTTGMNNIDILSYGDIAKTVAVQPDGKIIVAGYALNTVDVPVHDEIAIIRLNNDGTLDTGFGTEGITTSVVGGLNMETETGYGLAIDPNGKAVIAEAAGIANPGTRKFIAARYLAEDSDNNASTDEPWDTLADSFSFTDDTDVTVSSLQTSNVITISGLGTNVYVPVQITNGEYQINSGGYTTNIGYVTNGSQISVRHTSSSSPGTQTDTVLTVGGLHAQNNILTIIGNTTSDTYSSTTGADTVPNPFTFTDVTGVPLNTLQTSNTVTISDITGSLTPISIVGGSYSIDGGAYTSNPGTILNGQMVTVQHTSSGTDNTTVNTTLTIGGVSDTFSSTTADFTPAAFSFTDVSGVSYSSTMTSNTITVSGITAATTISITGGSYSINSGAYTSSSGTVANGDTVSVQHTSAATDIATVDTVLTIGGVSDTYSSTTADFTPAAFTFTDTTGAAVSSTMTSDGITVSGITAATPVSISGGTYSINGGTYTSANGTVSNGDTVTVQHTSAASENTTVNTTLTIGGVSDTYSSTTGDFTPAAFSFTDATGAEYSSTMTSNTITVSGINAATPISVTGGTYSINSGVYTSASGTVNNGDTVSVQHTSAATDNTTVNTTLTIGGVSDTYSSTTADFTPAIFSFTDDTGVAYSITMTSNAITVSGITAATPISITGGTYSINGGAYTSTAGTVINGDTVSVRHTSGATDNATVNTTLTIGGISDTYSSTTGDFTPAAFSFTDVTNVSVSSTMTSNEITISGINAATTISVTGGTYSINSGVYTDVSGTVNNGDTVSVRHTSSASDSTTVNSTLTIGGVSDTYSSTTGDFTPAAFSFTDVTGVTVSSTMTSNTITVSGITAATPISVSGGFYSINSGAYTSASGTVNNGDTISVQHTSAASDSTTVNTILTIGIISDTYSSTTGDFTPAVFSFTDVTGVPYSSTMTSNTITVSGINAPTAITVVGGTYSINGGAYISASGTVSNGDTVTIRHTSAPSEASTINTTLTIGGVSDTYSSTTGDFTPAAFSFIDVSDVDYNTTMTSNTITVSGINAATSISVSNGTYSINGGAYTTNNGTVNNGDTVTVQHTSAATDGTTVSTILIIGGVSDSFDSITTGDYVPDAFAFTDITGAMLNSLVISNEITISGITAPTPISVTGGGYSINGGPYTSNSGLVVNGNSITVRHTSAASDSTAVDTTLTIGGISDTFSSTTGDFTPDVFSFTDMTNVAYSTTMSSDEITVSGISAATPISITGGTYSINGGTYTSASGLVSNGDTVTVQHTSAATDITTVDTTLTIGSLSDTYSSTTADFTPTAFSFTDVTDVGFSSTITSDEITVAGITAATSISISGGSYSINGGSYTSSIGTINNGDTVTVQHTSAASGNTEVDSTLTIGGVSDTFSSTTAAEDTGGSGSGGGGGSFGIGLILPLFALVFLRRRKTNPY